MSKAFVFEDSKPVFFFRTLHTTDNRLVCWLWRVEKHELLWAKALGKKTTGKTDIVYIDNPECVKDDVVFKLVKYRLDEYKSKKQ